MPVYCVHDGTPLPDDAQFCSACGAAVHVPPPPPGGNALEEWKECRATIGRFDSVLVDLRKLGFGFVTTLIGAAAFVFSKGAPEGSGGQFSASTKFAGFFIISLLIVILYIIDIEHQIWLKTAVNRAKTLEDGLGVNITTAISKHFPLKITLFVQWLTYTAFSLITVGAFLASHHDDFQFKSFLTLTGYDGVMIGEVLVFQGVIVRSSVWSILA